MKALISRDGFEKSSAWLLSRLARGGFHAKWKWDDDGCHARLFDYASTSDRNAVFRHEDYRPDEAYEIVLSEFVASMEPDVVERFQNPRYGTNHLSARLTTLPADVDPYHLNSGKAKVGDVLFFLDEDDDRRMLIASTPDSDGDRSRKAAFIQVEKEDGLWIETAVSPELAAEASSKARAVRAMWVCDGLDRQMLQPMRSFGVAR